MHNTEEFLAECGEPAGARNLAPPDPYLCYSTSEYAGALGPGVIVTHIASLWTWLDGQQVGELAGQGVQRRHTDGPFLWRAKNTNGSVEILFFMSFVTVRSCARRGDASRQ